jgi:ABC-type molybdenum transport system ATPase subunit/photorepair protein PhrA
MKQFESISEQFTPNKNVVDEQLSGKKETAGMIRKATRANEKKEKTLSSKLRMKAKKNK